MAVAEEIHMSRFWTEEPKLRCKTIARVISTRQTNCNDRAKNYGEREKFYSI